MPTTVFQHPAQCLEHSKYLVFIEWMPSVKAISVYAPQAQFLIPLSTANKKKVIFKVSKHLDNEVPACFSGKQKLFKGAFNSVALVSR